MTKQTMIRNYRKYSAAESYILGFESEGNIYFSEIAEIPPRYIKVETASKKNGGHRKLQLRILSNHKKELLKNAETLCSIEDFTNGTFKNKGVEFEKRISEKFGIEYRGKDNIGFWVAGDLEIDGKQIQIKFNGAQIVVETTLEKLKKNKKSA